MDAPDENNTGNGNDNKFDNNDTNIQNDDDSKGNLLKDDSTNKTKSNANSDEKLKLNNEKEACKVGIEFSQPRSLIYRASENPPIHLTFIFGLQHTLVSLYSSLSLVIIASEVACCQEDNFLKVKILSATMFMAGFSTFMMTTFGVRLPIFQGPAMPYLAPLIAMQSLDEWKCPATYKAIDPLTNTTILMADMGNNTDIPNRLLSLNKLAQLSGSLMAAGGIHFLLGVTGMVGVLIRYIGPITIVPTITLIGLNFYHIIVKFMETDWIVAGVTFCINIILSLYLAIYKTPVPMWNRHKGFYIFWYPLHQVFSILIALCSGWVLSAILTSAKYYSDDPDSKQFLARADARIAVISQTDWFIYPYPGQFGMFSFSAGAFVNFMVATLMSVIDSIGDYSACARVSRVSPPPPFSFNRGLAVEGLMSTLSGSMGCCHATVSYGGNIGVIGITKVASRSVLQSVGLFYVIFAIFGKLGASFITIPYSVLGGLMLVITGIFIGLLLSYLQAIDLNSTRNLAIIGITMMMGFAIPHWVSKSPDGINTGNDEADKVIRMMLSNPAFIGGFFACFLDNTVPGTLEERGLLAQMKDLDDEEAKVLANKYEDGPELYRLPFLPDAFRRSRIAKIIPIFDIKEDQ